MVEEVPRGRLLTDYLSTICESSFYAHLKHGPLLVLERPSYSGVRPLDSLVERGETVVAAEYRQLLEREVRGIPMQL